MGKKVSKMKDQIILSKTQQITEAITTTLIMTQRIEVKQNVIHL